MNWIVETSRFRVIVKQDEEQIEIEIGDGYQQDLMNHHGWTQNQANTVDEMIQKGVKRKGFNCEVSWEDREFFTIELSSDNAGLDNKIVAEAICAIIPGSAIYGQSEL